MQYGNAAGAYQRNSILNASPEKLVVLMYDGAIQHLERARIGLRSPSQQYSSNVGMSLGKALAIISELRATLDHERGGEIAANLDRLYDYCVEQISATNIERRPDPIEAPIEVMKTLREGWNGVVPT